jgi:Ca-activated chloride channel family protein
MRKRFAAVLEPVWISLLVWCAAALWLLPPWLSDTSGLALRHPLFLLGWLVIPLMLYRAVRKRRRDGRVVHPLTGSMAQMPRGFRTYIPAVSTGFRTLAVALLFLALARPQNMHERVETDTEGVDLVLTLDMSGSMAEVDINPNRLEAAKEVMLDFISRRKNDRIGAVIFGENAYTLCPLTLDYSVLSSMIADLSLGVISDKATAIGNAVGVSLNRLRKSDAKSKAIILLTDGASNAGNISPEQATNFAKTLEVHIYTILVGQNDKGHAINPALLVQMAEETGGAYFRATDKRELASSFHKILNALEKSRIEDKGATYAEAMGKYLLLALLLIAVDLLLVLVIARRVP